MVKIFQFLMGIVILLVVNTLLPPIYAVILSIPLGMLIGALMLYSKGGDE